MGEVVEALLPQHRLFVVHKFFTRERCAELIQEARRRGFNLATQKQSTTHAARWNDRISYEDDAFAAQLWYEGGRFSPKNLFKDVMCVKKYGELVLINSKEEAKGEKIYRAVGLDPHFRFYRYRPGHRFGKHIDGSVDFDGDQHTMYTLLFYLTDATTPPPPYPETDLETEKEKEKEGEKEEEEDNVAEFQPLKGGETIFYAPHDLVAAMGGNAGSEGPPKKKEAKGGKGGAKARGKDKGGKKKEKWPKEQAIKVAPEIGAMLAHIHGAECLDHEGALVSEGVKYLLRTDVIFA